MENLLNFLIFSTGFLTMALVVLLSILILDHFNKNRSEAFYKLFYIVIDCVVIIAIILVIVILSSLLPFKG
jgi:hypothetical protein